MKPIEYSIYLMPITLIFIFLKRLLNKSNRKRPTFERLFSNQFYNDYLKISEQGGGDIGIKTTQASRLSGEIIKISMNNAN